MAEAATARRILSQLDLTSSDSSDDDPRITDPLCRSAAGRPNAVAAALKTRVPAETELGAGWCTRETFRLGASGLLDDLLRQLGGNAGSGGSSY
jgi:hypothetical protein